VNAAGADTALIVVIKQLEGPIQDAKPFLLRCRHPVTDMPPAAVGSVLPRSIYRFILRWSWRQQAVVLALTALSLPVYYLSLQLPKLIVNALSGRDVPKALFGWQPDPMHYLWLLCSVFLVLMLFNSGFSYSINLLKGRLGERMLRRLRFELYHRILRFPLAELKRVSAGELIPMITSEVEPLGGFIGDAVALPAQQGGTLLTALLFLVIQAPLLGLAALVVLPVQGTVIPRLQRRVNLLGKDRVRAIRGLGDRIGETVAAAPEIQAENGVRRQLAEFAERLGRIYEIRFEIYRRKFFAKVLNNFLNQLPPLFFFSVGGWLVIQGSLSFAALVAVIAAYKDLAAPWKALLDWYQAKEDSRIKYEQVIEQFQPPGLIDPALQLAVPEPVQHFTGAVELRAVTVAEPGGRPALDTVDLTLPLDRSVAILGDATSGKVELGWLLGRLIQPRSGLLLIDGVELTRLPYAVTGRRIGYVGPAATLFAGSLRDNLVAELRRVAAGMQLDGSLHFATPMGKIDLEAAGVADAAGLEARLVELLGLVGLDQDVFRLGLQGRLDPAAAPDAAERILAAREALAELLQRPELGLLVERFEPDRFNNNLSLGKNLLFGTSHDPAVALESLAEAPPVRRILDRLGLTAALVDIGRSMAETMLELFADLPPGHDYFERFGFIAQDELPDYQRLLARGARTARDRQALLRLSFKLIEARHRLNLVDEGLRDQLVAARQVLRRELPAGFRDEIDFFEPGRYSAAASILDNLLFGRIVYGVADAAPRVERVVADLIEARELRAIVLAAGLDSPAGSAGARLTPLQRQKLAIARAVLKRPDLLVLNQATQVLDPYSQAEILGGLLRECAGRGLIAVLQRAELARGFDRAVVLERGRVVEQGDVVALDRPDTSLTMLRQAEAS
jgi:putative ABC transport system ATP-binding protein